MKIRLRQNGPYVIDDADVQVVDWNGVEYRVDRHPVALCRCGASATRPFCDGTHKRIGWQGAEPAPTDGPDAHANPESA